MLAITLRSLEAPGAIPPVEFGFFDSIRHYRVVLVILSDWGDLFLSRYHFCFFHLFHRNRKSGVDEISHNFAV